MIAAILMLLGIDRREQAPVPDPLMYLSDRLMAEQKEVLKWKTAAEVYRREAIKFASALSPLGGYELEKRCEEEIKSQTFYRCTMK